VRRAGGWDEEIRPAPADAPAPPSAHPTLGKPAASWAYRDRAGELLGYVCRFNLPGGTKEFRPLTLWRHTGTGARNWRWKSWAAPRPLYGLDRLAARPEAPVLLAEGEKAADAAGRLLPEFVAVASPGGAQGPGKVEWGALARRRVVIWPDADPAGRDYALRAARALLAMAAEVLAIEPPAGMTAGWDAADAEVEGWDTARAQALADAARPGGPASAGDGESGNRKEGGDGSDGRKRGAAPPQRSVLADLIGEESELWHSPDREAFATVPVNGHFENWPVRSRDFRHTLVSRFYKQHDGAPGGQALEDAIRLIEAKALNDGSCYPTWRRVGEAAKKIYIDLCDAAWRAVEIDAEGWRVIARPPVKFLRSRGMLSLPDPEAGGVIELLRGYVNLDGDAQGEADFKLVVAWLVGALRPRGPFPILLLNGEQGSGKTIVMRVLRALVDPNVSVARAAPRDERDLFIAAWNSWTLSLDNVSGIPEWLSDALCRLATGGGFVTRELHSDRDEIILDAWRPIMANGIPDLGGRPDLGDRALAVTLPRLDDEHRRAEETFWVEFEAHRPAILGALYDAVSRALARLDKVRLDRLPRLADFARWVEAAAPALGWGPGEFIAAYASNRAAGVQTAIENDPVAQAVRSLALGPAAWEGTASELLPVLDDRVSEATRRSRSWPTTAAGLGGRLRRVAPALRSVGVVVTQRREGQDRRRMWTIDTTARTGAAPAVESDALGK
jgi:hypothetical protein